MPVLPSSHFAAVLHEQGDPSRLDLRIESVATRPPGAGEALVRLQTAALNHRDLWIRKGAYGRMAGLPCALGSDGYGVVESVGSESDGHWVGRAALLYPGLDWGPSNEAPGPAWRILGVPDAGTWAGAVTVPVAQLYPAPPGYSPEEAAALPLAGVTAYRALFRRGGLSPRNASGQRILITGIGGGVAQFLLQFALAAGAEVWVTSGSPQKRAAAKAAGAHGGVLYTEEDWGAALAREAGAFDLCVDSAGGPGWSHLCEALRPGGKLVYFGATRGTGEIPMRKAFFKQLDILGTALGSAEDFRDMLQFVEEKKIRPVIDAVFPLAEAEQALARMDEGVQTGKIVLRIS
jgi:NADPH:quinone reductase-like Zn-dependent oxidoreductase